MTRRAVMSWSSGKDSAFALHLTRQAGDREIVALLSTFNETHDRVAVHGTRRAIARAQASALGLPLIEVDLPDPCSNADYEARIGDAVQRMANDDVRDWVFGDLFLEDIRAYRETQLANHGARAQFPLWGMETAALSEQMLAAGLVAHVVTLDPSRVPRALCGAHYDADFLSRLPADVDPCGENGEFHTLVSDGPGFAAPLTFERGETVERGGFVYTDFTLRP